MRHLAHVADRIFCKPLLVHPGKLEVLLSVLGPRIAPVMSDSIRDVEIDDDANSEFLRGYFMRERKLSPAANRLIDTVPGGPIDKRGRQRWLYNLHNNTAIIPIIGSLINRGAFVGDDGSGAVSYEGLSTQIRAAAADPVVHSILLDIDSPGGEANGMTDMAAAVRDARDKKHVVAFVNDMAASAAYGIAAQADEIVISPTSITGSIGVVLVHLDHSRQLEKKGITPTFIHAGAHKIDGNPLQPLSDAVRADLQSDVNQYYQTFLDTVAAGRAHKGLTAERARQTEAKIFVGASALEQRVADRVGNFADTLAALRLLGGPKMDPSIMSTFVPAASVDLTTSVPLAEHTAAITQARQEADAAGHARGYDEGVRDAIARFRQIVSSEHATDRMPMAVKLALGRMPTEEAIEFLKELPVTKAVPPISERSADVVNNLGSDNPAPPREQMSAAWERTFKRMGIAIRN